MTDSISFAPRLFPASSAHPEPQLTTVLPLLPRLPRRTPSPVHSTLPHVPAEDRAGQGLLLGLVAATLPAIGYSLLQAWNLAGSDALVRAVRTFVP